MRAGRRRKSRERRPPLAAPLLVDLNFYLQLSLLAASSYYSLEGLTGVLSSLAATFSRSVSQTNLSHIPRIQQAPPPSLNHRLVVNPLKNPLLPPRIELPDLHHKLLHLRILLELLLETDEIDVHASDDLLLGRLRVPGGASLGVDGAEVEPRFVGQRDRRPRRESNPQAANERQGTSEQLQKERRRTSPDRIVEAVDAGVESRDLEETGEEDGLVDEWRALLRRSFLLARLAEEGRDEAAGMLGSPAVERPDESVRRDDLGEVGGRLGVEDIEGGGGGRDVGEGLERLGDSFLLLLVER